MISQKTVGAEATDALADSISSCSKIDGLDAIKEVGTELVIWHRTLPSELKDWFKQLNPLTLPYLRIFALPGELRSALEPLLDECGMPQGCMREMMINDITVLAHAFSRITKSKRIDLRLEHINDNACRRFHIDHVEARLLTTYLGPATEWVKPAHAERAINEQKNFSGPLERLSNDDVAFFKGNNTGIANGIVHRSPPVKGTGKSRLLLCLNKQSEVTPDPWNLR